MATISERIDQEKRLMSEAAANYQSGLAAIVAELQSAIEALKTERDALKAQLADVTGQRDSALKLQAALSDLDSKIAGVLSAQPAVDAASK